MTVRQSVQNVNCLFVILTGGLQSQPGFFDLGKPGSEFVDLVPDMHPTRSADRIQQAVVVEHILGKEAGAFALGAFAPRSGAPVLVAEDADRVFLGVEVDRSRIVVLLVHWEPPSKP